MCTMSFDGVTKMGDCYSPQCPKSVDYVPPKPAEQPKPSAEWVWVALLLAACAGWYIPPWPRPRCLTSTGEVPPPKGSTAP